ncbi:response regulator transcription factor [Flavobacterium amniphilum]|jgi:DNA-binding NarL/FixJ family response regulator|uniref:response regulator transcription factor n=1 Tax=Flavobacterium amniphilum TaxID=1834035 RepID=UPI00202A290F|nr:response regulator transcription factor [Flavobacterium amniphilum]MCL9805290.1 response regulator transcription factor [Flavobacterium amniphilum]
MDTKIKIHLADDHQVLIDGLLAVLRTNPIFEVVGFSLNGDGLVERVAQNDAHILVMDINMPEKDGIQVLREFNEKGFTCKVIVLSSYDDPKLIKEVIKLGASGYLTKQSAGDSILDAIMTVAQGSQYFSANIKDKIFDIFTENNNRESLRIEDVISNITTRELEILGYICEEKSGKDIGELLNISPNTVETHRKNLMKKLKVKSSVGLVLFATKHNLININ